MYPHVRKWLKDLLDQKYPNDSVSVYDTHAQNLSAFLMRKNLHKFFPDFQSYEIKVDVSGVIKRQNTAHLVFIECKLAPISLKDFSQLLGYSKVAKPIHSVIVSPKDVSTPVSYLFRTLRRYDVLYYDTDKKILLGKWSKARKSIVSSSIIPAGEHL